MKTVWKASFVLLYEEISNSCFQIKVLKHNLRISILSFFSLFYFFFPPYHILLITSNAVYVASSARIFFFTYHRSQDFFGGIITPPLVISNGPSLTSNTITYIPPLSYKRRGGAPRPGQNVVLADLATIHHQLGRNGRSTTCMLCDFTSDLE